MPVPGSLKKQPVNADKIAQLLEDKFQLPKMVTRAYLVLVQQGEQSLNELGLHLKMTIADSDNLLKQMVDRGLVIRASEERFQALHPRMTLTNLFKVYEEDLVKSLRDRRATVDRVVNLLTPIFEEGEKK